jgi:hypothetical protein
MRFFALVASAVVGPCLVQGASCEASSFTVKEGDTLRDVKAKLREDCKDEGYSVDFCNKVLPALLDELFKGKDDDALFDESHCSPLQGLIEEHHLQQQQALRERAAAALLGNSSRAPGRFLEKTVDTKSTCRLWQRDLHKNAPCGLTWKHLEKKCEICWHCEGNDNYCGDWEGHEHSRQPPCASMSCATTTTSTQAAPSAHARVGCSDGDDACFDRNYNQLAAFHMQLMSFR